MFEFGFKNKTDLPEVKINKNIFSVFDRAKKTKESEVNKEEKSVHFKFTGDGEAQRFINSDLVEQLGNGIEESLAGPKKVDPEIQIHQHREKNILKKMISSAYENIFNIEIPEDEIDIKKEFEEAKKGGKFNRIRASFATTMRNKVGLSNEEIEEKMKEYYLKNMKDLDLSEEAKNVILNDWKISEVEIKEEVIDNQIEAKAEESLLETRIIETENLLEYLKERINSSTEDDLQACSFYREELGKFNKDGLSEEDLKKMNTAVSECQNKINEVWEDKKQKIKYEGRLNYRIEMVHRALNGLREDIKKIKSGEIQKMKPLAFYVNNVSKPNEDGLEGKYLEKLRSVVDKAKKEIIKSWEEKKHELEIEKNKKEFESAIKKIRDVSKEEYGPKYGSKYESELLFEYDIRNKIKEHLSYYLNHVAHPIDASQAVKDWDGKWEKIRLLVEKINSETQYELVVVDGKTYSVQVQDQDFSHMTESYDSGFKGEKHDPEDQFSNIVGNFEGYIREENSVEDSKSEGGEKHGDDSVSEIEQMNLKNENENENWKSIFAKLPTPVIDVFERYCLALHVNVEVENLTETEIADYLREHLLQKIEENKEFLFKEYNFDEKDAIIFAERIIKKYKNKLGHDGQF